MIMRGTNTCSILDLSNNTFLGLISNQQLRVRYKTNVVSLRQYYYRKLLRILSEKARKNERSHEEIDVQNELTSNRPQTNLPCKTCLQVGIAPNMNDWTKSHYELWKKKITYFLEISEFFPPFSAGLSMAAPKGGHLSSKGREL